VSGEGRVTRIDRDATNSCCPTPAVPTAGNLDVLGGERKIDLSVDDTLRGTEFGIVLGPRIAIKSISLIAGMTGTWQQRVSMFLP
jgi:hypothetical protein